MYVLLRLSLNISVLFQFYVKQMNGLKASNSTCRKPRRHLFLGFVVLNEKLGGFCPDVHSSCKLRPELCETADARWYMGSVTQPWAWRHSPTLSHSF
jgi:hypothetical protein